MDEETEMTVTTAGKLTQSRVLGIVGSPRRGGNTEILVDEVLRGAREGGAIVEKVFLSDLDIAPCQACDSCEETGDCVQGDDMGQVLERMDRAQVWVLGTPVYWWGPTAQFKGFLDRWYGARRLVFRGRRAILVIPLGDSYAGTARHTTGMLDDALSYVGIEISDTVLAPGAMNAGDVRRQATVLAAARRAGRNAAYLYGRNDTKEETRSRE
jgi:multimeric flavodoxin WrbA